MPEEWTIEESVWTAPDGKQVPFVSKKLWVEPEDGSWSSYQIELSIFSHNTRISLTEISGADEDSYIEHRRTVGKYPNDDPAIARCVDEIVRRINSGISLW